MFNKEEAKELEEEGFVRELMRRVQNLRKRANLIKQDEIVLAIETTEKWVENYSKEIMKKVNAKTMTVVHETKEDFTFSSKEKIKGKDFHLMLDKL